MSMRRAVIFGLVLVAPAVNAQVLLKESFHDANVTSRGWYDVPKVVLSTREHVSAPSSAQFRFLQGAKITDTERLRRRFSESESVYLSYHIKYSDNWQGSGMGHHPHQFHFLTNLDTAYSPLAFTRLTTYIEEIGGRMQLAIQDASNIDQTRINQNLVGITENRAVAGCNGDTDRYRGRCYLWGDKYRNIKDWKAPIVSFQHTEGKYYKGNWHKVEAFIKLNSIADGRAVADGAMQLWVNGEQLLDHRDVVLRTGRHANMKFNQIIIAPYIGDKGSPADQAFWVDDVLVATQRPEGAVAPPSPPRNLRLDD